jgi:hypothetical protein
MAMRYIVRRQKPEDLSDIKSQIPDLETQLGKADKEMRRSVRHPIGPSRHLTYQFVTRSVGPASSWVCPSIELVAEDEKGLFALTDLLQVPGPEHLKNHRS